MKVKLGELDTQSGLLHIKNEAEVSEIFALTEEKKKYEVVLMSYLESS